MYIYIHNYIYTHVHHIIHIYIYVEIGMSHTWSPRHPKRNSSVPARREEKLLIRIEVGSLLGGSFSEPSTSGAWATPLNNISYPTVVKLQMVISMRKMINGSLKWGVVFYCHVKQFSEGYWGPSFQNIPKYSITNTVFEKHPGNSWSYGRQLRTSRME